MNLPTIEAAIVLALVEMAENDLDVASRIEDFRAFIAATRRQLPGGKIVDITQLQVALEHLSAEYPTRDAADESEYRLRLMEAGKDELR